MTAHTALRRNLMRIVPLAFIAGAGIELFMTYVRVGNETFYDTAKRLESQRREQRRKDEEEMKQRVRMRVDDSNKESDKEETAVKLH